MRLVIKVLVWNEKREKVIKTIYRYDVGIRAIEDKYNVLSKSVVYQGKQEPRFLEDWIEKFGRENVYIVSYGDYKLNGDIIEGKSN